MFPSYYARMQKLQFRKLSRKNWFIWNNGAWRGILWGPWATRKMDKWVLEPVKPEYGHGRQGSLEDKSAGKGSRQQEKRNKQEVGCVCNTSRRLSLQELSGPVRTGHRGCHSLVGSPGVRADSTAPNTRFVMVRHQSLYVIIVQNISYLTVLLSHV